MLGLGGGALAQEILRGATSPAPDLKVVLSWPEVAGSARFNVYRKAAAAPSYPATPLNSAPLQPLTSCPAIQAIIPVGSEEWNLLASSLTDDPNDPMSPPFDPCAVSTVAKGTAKYARLQLLARASFRIAVVIGQGLIDTTVVAGQSFNYQLRGVAADGTETGAIGSDVTLVAGTPAALPPPAPITSHPGDRQVLIVFGDVPGAAGFIVRRGTNPAGPFVRVNERTFTARFQHDLDGNLLAPGGTYFNGFVDFQHWDLGGNPIPHVVQGNPVNGPDNGVTYYYQVASVDLLQQAGAFSAPAVAATPLDKTPPATPTEVTIAADEVLGNLLITWVKVERDVLGHVDPGVANYRVFRYETSQDVAAPNVQVALVPHVSGGTTTMTRDRRGPQSPVRLRREDLVVSRRSRRRHGERRQPLRRRIGSPRRTSRRRSLRPASRPKGSKITSRSDGTRTTSPISPAIRSTGASATSAIGSRARRRREPDKPGREGHDQPGGAPKPEPPPEPCSGPFVLIATLTKVEAQTRAATRPDGKVFFDDFTVPLGSPLCYAYLIKAIDTSLNMSGVVSDSGRDQGGDPLPAPP